MSEITLIVNPQPGVRLLGGNAVEDGAILAFRKGGDEVLFGSLSDDNRPLVWIPVGEFSIDPGAIEPVEIEPGGGEEPDDRREEEPAEEPPQGPAEEPQSEGTTPFGRVRPELEGR